MFYLQSVDVISLFIAEACSSVSRCGVPWLFMKSSAGTMGVKEESSLIHTSLGWLQQPTSFWHQVNRAEVLVAHRNSGGRGLCACQATIVRAVPTL